MLCCLGCKKIENNLLSLSRRNVQLPREGEQAVDINTKVIEITVKKFICPSLCEDRRQTKNKLPQSFDCGSFVVYLL